MQKIYSSILMCCLVFALAVSQNNCSSKPNTDDPPVEKGPPKPVTEKDAEVPVLKIGDVDHSGIDSANFTVSFEKIPKEGDWKIYVLGSDVPEVDVSEINADFLASFDWSQNDGKHVGESRKNMVLTLDRKKIFRKMTFWFGASLDGKKFVSILTTEIDIASLKVAITPADSNFIAYQQETSADKVEVTFDLKEGLKTKTGEDTKREEWKIKYIKLDAPVDISTADKKAKIKTDYWDKFDEKGGVEAPLLEAKIEFDKPSDGEDVNLKSILYALIPPEGEDHDWLGEEGFAQLDAIKVFKQGYDPEAVEGEDEEESEEGLIESSFDAKDEFFVSALDDLGKVRSEYLTVGAARLSASALNTYKDSEWLVKKIEIAKIRLKESKDKALAKQFLKIDFDVNKVNSFFETIDEEIKLNFDNSEAVDLKTSQKYFLVKKFNGADIKYYYEGTLFETAEDESDGMIDMVLPSARAYSEIKINADNEVETIDAESKVFNIMATMVQNVVEESDSKKRKDGVGISIELDSEDITSFKKFDSGTNFFGTEENIKSFYSKGSGNLLCLFESIDNSSSDFPETMAIRICYAKKE